MVNNHQQCINSILKILSNIVSTSLDLAKIVFRHEIFSNVVIHWAHRTAKQVILLIIFRIIMKMQYLYYVPSSNIVIYR